MQDKHLYEYAVIRIMPRVEREEFINTGVVLYCARLKFLGAMVADHSSRLHAFCPSADAEEIAEHLQAFQRICKGGKAAGPIGELPIAERFRWLTATRSTVVQSSKVHPGFCTNAGEMMEKLFGELVAC